MTARKATAIVLAWNRWDLTKRCLDTLRQTDLCDAEVLVVDNGSTDDTPRGLAGYDWIRVVRNPANLGFVRGNNAGVAAADPESDIVLLNNDLEFHQADWLQRLRRSAHCRKDAGIVGCRLALPDGRLLHAGAFMMPDTCWGQQLGALEKDIGQYPGLREVESIAFACAYIRRETIRAVGGLSEAYESYFEDTDYSLRAREKGFRTLVDGDVTLMHREHGSTSGDRKAFREIFQKSRETFRRHWVRQLEARYTRELVWHSIMNFPTGYASSCREILKALDRAGVRLTYQYVYGPGTPFPTKEAEISGDYLLDTIRLRRAPARPALSVVYGQGDVFHRNAGRRRVGFTMLEVDGFPKEWVKQANALDEVWVPTEFNRRGFLDSGLERPVHLIPLGVDPNYFHPAIKGFPNPDGEFVFLSNFEWGERKDPWLLLRAFNDTFRATEPVRLLCKVINKDASVRVLDEIRRLALDPAGGRLSFIFNRDFPYYQLGAFYRSADCYVSAGRGEGWDMPLIEAMACGLPTIATDWGAHTEFVHGGISYPLRVRATIPAIAKCPYYDGRSWADPDPEHLRFLLRHVYENRDEARGKGAAAAREVAQKWTWDRTAARIVARLDELASTDRVGRPSRIEAPRQAAAPSAPPDPPRRAPAPEEGSAERLAAVARLWDTTAAERQAKPIQGWLDSPIVQQTRIQPRITGDRDRDWLQGLWRRLGLPAGGRWLSLGCGVAGPEIAAARAGLFDSMLALDASADSLEIARKSAAERGVTNIAFELCDLDRVMLGEDEFDVALMIMSLHHVRELRWVLSQVRQALRSDGLFIVNEFVGPRQFQFSDEQLAVVRELLAALPERYRRDSATGAVKTEYVRLPVEHWNVADPSEAIRSDRILPEIRRQFRIVERFDYGGTILNPLLEHIVHNFDANDERDVALISMLGTIEDLLIAGRMIPSDFTAMVMRKKPGLAGLLPRAPRASSP